MPQQTRASDFVKSYALPLAAALFLVMLSAAALVCSAEGVPDLTRRLSPPLRAVGYPLGTDALGRDLVGRLMLGARNTLALAVAAVSLSLIIGSAVGFMAGFWRGWLDSLAMATTDLALSFPSLLLALVVVYALGPSVRNVLAVLVLTRWMVYARVVRAEVLRLRKMDYVRAARAVGGSSVWIVRKHLLPALGGVLASVAAMEATAVALAESSLSYLGLGVQPPGASLGLLVAQGAAYMGVAPWLTILPGGLLFAIVLACTLLAQGLGAMLNPARK